MEKEFEETRVKKQHGQIAREVDRLEDVTATLVQKVAELETASASVCNQSAPAIKENSVIVQDDENEGAVLAITLAAFGERVGSAVYHIGSILDRLEL